MLKEDLYPSKISLWDNKLSRRVNFISFVGVVLFQPKIWLFFLNSKTKERQFDLFESGTIINKLVINTLHTNYSLKYLQTKVGSKPLYKNW